MRTNYQETRQQQRPLEASDIPLLDPNLKATFYDIHPVLEHRLLLMGRNTPAFHAACDLVSTYILQLIGQRATAAPNVRKMTVEACSQVFEDKKYEIRVVIMHVKRFIAKNTADNELATRIIDELSEIQQALIDG